MKLGVSMLPIHTPGGIGRYTRILGAVLLSYFEDELYVFLQSPSDLSAILAELPEEERQSFRLKPKTSIIYSKYPHVARFLINQWEIPIRLKTAALDIYLEADLVLPPLKGPKLFVVAHDMTPFTNPSFLGAKARLIYGISAKRSLRRADKIICVSERTRSRLTDIFPSLSERAVVLNSCLSPKFYAWARAGYMHSECLTVRAEFGSISIARPFILFVGVEARRKNISTLIDAFHILRSKGYKHILVMVGGRAEKPMVRAQTLTPLAVPTGGELAIQSNLPSILRLGRVPDEDLAQLYRHADLVPLISLEEGFGYPVLEALSFRTPVLVPQCSPLAKWAEGAAVFVADPLDAELVAQKMEEAIKRAGELSYNCWARIDRELFSPERYFDDLMRILRG